MGSPALTARELRSAIEHGEIVPWFQPIAEVHSGKICGFEALARWIHPELGVVPPDMFIPLAEDYALITPLTEAILSRACAAMRTLPDYLRLCVNVSPIQLRDRALPSLLQKAVGDFPLGRLTLEITETALVGNIELARQIVDNLKALGVRLALDDFGTGYSSLYHLHSFPFDEIKVDRSFVQSMTDRRESRKIAAAVIGLGHSLGLTTVAEGIEDTSSAGMLFYLGCEMGQGWLYGKPVPASELSTLLDTSPRYPARQTPRLANEIATQLERNPVQRLAELQAIYDGAPVGLCFLDRSLHYVNMNQRLAEMSYAPFGPRLGKLIREATPFVYAQMEAFLERTLQGESFSGLEIQTARPNATNTWNTLLVSIQPVRDEAGEIVGISLAAADITERKLAEEALRESEDHYRHTVELNPQVQWTAAPDGGILSASRRWEELTGMKIEDAMQEGWRKAVHPDDMEAAGARWMLSLQTGQPLENMFRVGKGDGHWRWMRVRAWPRRDMEGRIIRWYGIVEDIETERQKEAALRIAEGQLNAVLRVTRHHKDLLQAQIEALQREVTQLEAR